MYQDGYDMTYHVFENVYYDSCLPFGSVLINVPSKCVPKVVSIQPYHWRYTHRR